MRKTLSVALCTLVLSAVLTSCTLTVTPGLELQPAPEVVQLSHVNSTLGLRVYPGAVVRQHREDRRSSRTDFDSAARLSQVYDFYHTQLVANGWRRERLSQNDRAQRVEARYRRNDTRIELELNRRGESGQYRIEFRDR
jgi:hypothetical protein